MIEVGSSQEVAPPDVWPIVLLLMSHRVDGNVCLTLVVLQLFWMRLKANGTRQAPSSDGESYNGVTFSSSFDIRL